MDNAGDNTGHRKFAVVEFPAPEGETPSASVIPCKWLDEDDDGNLFAYWFPKDWSDPQRNSAVAHLRDADPLKFRKCYGVRILHTYNSYLVARLNCKKAEDTSGLESEMEVLRRGARKRKQARRGGDSDEDRRKPRSKHPAPSYINTVAHSSNIAEKQAKGQSNSQNKKSTALSKNTSSSKETNVKSNPQHETQKARSSPRSVSLESFASPPQSHEAISVLSPMATSPWTVSKAGPDQASMHSPISRDSSRDTAERTANHASLVKKNLFHTSNDSNKQVPTVSSNRSNEAGDEASNRSEKKNKTANDSLKSSELKSVTTFLSEINVKLDAIGRHNAAILRAVRPARKLVIPSTMPSLPLDSLKSFENFEKLLSVNSENVADVGDYLAHFIIPDSSMDMKVYAVLRRALTDKLACHFNWKGTGDKKTFEKTKLQSAIACALLAENRNLKMSTAEEPVKKWLKNAPKRAGVIKLNRHQSSSSKKVILESDSEEGEGSEQAKKKKKDSNSKKKSKRVIVESDSEEDSW